MAPMAPPPWESTSGFMQCMAINNRVLTTPHTMLLTVMRILLPQVARRNMQRLTISSEVVCIQTSARHNRKFTKMGTAPMLLNSVMPPLGMRKVEKIRFRISPANHAPIILPHWSQ